MSCLQCCPSPGAHATCLTQSMCDTAESKCIADLRHRSCPSVLAVSSFNIPKVPPAGTQLTPTYVALFHIQSSQAKTTLFSTVDVSVLHPILNNLTNKANAAATCLASSSLTSIITEPTCPITSFADTFLASPKKKKSRSSTKLSGIMVCPFRK